MAPRRTDPRIGSFALILDMDGLLLDTEPIAVRALRQAGVDLGYTLDDEVLDRMIGLNSAAGREVLLRHFGDDFPAGEFGATCDVRYREYLGAGDIPHKPGLSDFFRFVDERGIPRAVATSTATELATDLLRRAGVLHHLHVVVGGDQVNRSKPEPDIFLMAAARLDRRPDDCTVLEDSGPGIRAAVAAGMRAILIPDRHAPTSEIRQTAHVVVDSLLAARAVIETMLDEASFRE